MPTRMLEMRLMHQYLMSTYHTLAQDGLSAYHLSMAIPQMATSFPFLLDSLLALSALHLASLDVDSRLTWLDTAVRYQSQACSGLGKILSEISLQHYEPAFVSSVFIIIFATGFHSISTENNPGDPISPVLEVRTLLSGASMLFNRFNEVGSNGELSGWLCVPGTEETLETESNGSVVLISQAVRNFITHTRFSDLSSHEVNDKLFSLHKYVTL